jgi:integrase/recombinase XerC
LLLSRQGKRLAVRSIRHAVERVSQASGVDLSPHVLRHTFGTGLVRGGKDLVQIADLMGHASIETTRQYARASQEDMADAVEVLNIDY